MKIVVITGSTRGIGFGMAQAFLAEGCAVVISGRTQAAVDQALAKLAESDDPSRLSGWACDVTRFDQVQTLWDHAVDRFGRVDIWINNAGLAHAQTAFPEFTPEQIEEVVTTNLIGSMYGSLVAVRGLQRQGGGSLYNMEGLGSNRRQRVSGMSLYASTKAGLRSFNDALIRETAGTPVLVGAIQPGMVLTGLLMAQSHKSPEEWERSKRIFNILADRVETVTPWLARQILENSQHGKRIVWLKPAKLMGRFLSAPFIKRSVVD